MSFHLPPLLVAVFLLVSSFRRWMIARKIASDPEAISISTRTRVIAGLVACAIFGGVFLLYARLSHEMWLRVALGAAVLGGLEQAALAFAQSASWVLWQYRIVSLAFLLSALLILFVQ